MIYLSDKYHFENDAIKNYLTFQPTFKYFKTSSAKSNQIIAWKFNGLSEAPKIMKPPTAWCNSLAFEIKFFSSVKIKKEIWWKLSEAEKNDFLSRKYSKCAYFRGNKLRPNNLDNKFTLLNSLFGAAKLIKKIPILASILILKKILDLMCMELLQCQMVVSFVKM